MKRPAKGVELATLRDESAEAVLVRERAHLALTLAAKQLELEVEAQPGALAAITVDDEGDYAVVTELRASVRSTKDELVTLRQSAAQPWKRVATTIEAMFRPAIRAAETIEADFRGKLEAYQLAKVQREREARELATQAAQSGDSATMLAALTESAALAQATPDGGAVRLQWAVERVVQDLLPDEWWTPDTAKIEAVAKAHRGDEPPVIPGVIFKQAASVAVRR